MQILVRTPPKKWSADPMEPVFYPLEDLEVPEMGKMSQKLPSPPREGGRVGFGLKNAKLGPPEASKG